MNRRDTLKHIAALAMATLTTTGLSFRMQNLLERPILSSGEKLPVVGLGTWQTFDVGNSVPDREALREVLKVLVSSGARVVDSSPMYGSSEKVVGELSSELKLNEQLFMATKVWTNGSDAGKKQMLKSMQLLKRDAIELMQVHNLFDWQTHLKTLSAWKEEGKIKYIGLTHYLDSAHQTIENIISKNKIDFIQINYSLASRNAENRLFAAAADYNVSVLVNRPFEEGQLFSMVKGKTLPPWASEFDCTSWGQFFLKFILSNPHVTCVIPGTSKAKHLIDNIGAGIGRLPNPATRKKMIEFLG